MLVPTEPRAVVVAGHAMMVDRRTLERPGGGLISHLVVRDIAVVWPDLRGHGQSEPRADQGGRWSYDDLVDRDAPALYRFARTRWPDLPLVSVGHSLFGHVALAHLARYGRGDRGAVPDGLVALGANLWGRRWEPNPVRWVAKRLLLAAMEETTRLWGYFPARQLRIASCDESIDYVDQLVGFARTGWVAKDGFSYADALGQIAKPVLSLAAAGDRLLCHPACAQRMAAEIPGAIYETVGRATGLATDGGHMAMVIDPGFRPMWDRVADFVLNHCGGSLGTS